MVPHHLQAIEMADLVPTRTRNADVVGLASRIRSAQQPEVEAMTGWLASFGAAPPVDHGSMEGHGTAGMASADALRELATLRDAAFDRRWLTLMVEHHEGAVTMAQTVLRDGEHAGTRALAQAVVREQTAEIAEMSALLAR